MRSVPRSSCGSVTVMTSVQPPRSPYGDGSPTIGGTSFLCPIGGTSAVLPSRWLPEAYRSPRQQQQKTPGHRATGGLLGCSVSLGAVQEPYVSGAVGPPPGIDHGGVTDPVPFGDVGEDHFRRVLVALRFTQVNEDGDEAQPFTDEDPGVTPPAGDRADLPSVVLQVVAYGCPFVGHELRVHHAHSPQRN